MFIDSHCHLFYEDFAHDLDAVINRALESNVTSFIVPATNPDTAEQAIAIAEQYQSVFAAVGYHPLDLKTFSDDGMSRIEEMIGHKKVVAVGEIGIDYFYDTSPREYQQEIFSRQINLAVTHDLPIIVHTRDSVQDAIDLVAATAVEHPEWRNGINRGVFHCFTGDAGQANRLFDLGFYVSFPGPVTFKKNSMPDVVRAIGLDRIMVETDSPFLTPVPFRGKRNEPSYIPIIANRIAEILDVSVEHVAERTTANARTLFNLPAL